MKKIFSFLLSVFLILSTVSCAANKAVPKNNSENTKGTEELSENESADSTKNTIMPDDNWNVQLADSSVVSQLKETFVTAWNSGQLSIDFDWSPAKDEILKDVVIFKSTKQQDVFSEYYCLVYASVHLKEMYRNDGSTYYVFSDKNDKLVDVYMFSSLEFDSRVLAFDLYGFFFKYEDAIAKLKDFCGEDLISVLNTEQRLSIIDAVNENSNVSGTYSEVKRLLEEGNFTDAQQLYYKTDGLTYDQSRDCLLLITEYELLYMETSPIANVVEDLGTFTLESYLLNSWQDKDYSNDENDVVIYVEYHAKSTHPILGNQKHSDYLTIPVTLDVEGKTFVKR